LEVAIHEDINRKGGRGETGKKEGDQEAVEWGGGEKEGAK